MPSVVNICVSDPLIESSPLRSHGTFRITSEILYDVNGVENSRKVILTTRRRFREFVLLQECFRANNPGCILPPLPAQTIHVHPSMEFLQDRVVLLQRYLHSVLGTKALYTDPAFWLFVECENFPSMVAEFKLREKNEELFPTKRVPRDSPRFADALEDRLDYLIKISARLEILKSSLIEFCAAHQDLAEKIQESSKALTGYLDAATDCGRHANLIHLIDSMDNVADNIRMGTVDNLMTTNCSL